jgi:hypothetical protein
MQDRQLDYQFELPLLGINTKGMPNNNGTLLISGTFQEAQKGVLDSLGMKEVYYKPASDNDYQPMNIIDLTKHSITNNIGAELNGALVAVYKKQAYGDSGYTPKTVMISKSDIISERFLDDDIH